MHRPSRFLFTLGFALLLGGALGCTTDSTDEGAGYRDSCKGGVACGNGLTCSPTLEMCVSPGEAGAPCVDANECSTDACRKGVCSQGVQADGICQEHEDCGQRQLACVKPTGQSSGICRWRCDPDAGPASCTAGGECCMYAPLADFVCAPSELCE